MANQSISFVATDKLLLDLENARFPHVMADQAEAEAYIAEHEDLGQLYDSILSDGFMEIGESLFVMPAAGIPDSFVVLEGNRRLAACRKLNLEHPDKAVLSLRCVAFDTRDSALAALTKRHQEGPRKWGALEKHNFYLRLFKGGHSITEISTLTTTPANEVQKTIEESLFANRMMDAYNVSEAVKKTLSDIGPDILYGRVRNNLEKDLHFSYDAISQDIKFATDPTFNASALTKFDAVSHDVISAIVTAKIDTRVINKYSDWKKMVDRDTAIPGLKTKIGDLRGLSSTSLTNHSRRHRRSSTSEYRYICGDIGSFIHSGTHVPQKIRDVATELRSLDFDTSKYASVLLFRALLELSLRQYADNHHSDINPATPNYVFCENALESTALGALNSLRARGVINRAQHSAINVNLTSFTQNCDSYVHLLTESALTESMFEWSKNLIVLINYLLNY